MVKQRIVFFGNERIATGLGTDAPVLRALIAAGYDIEAVVASNDESRSRKKRELEIQKVAEDNQIPLYLPSSSRELQELCSAFSSEIAVLIAYGRMVPQSVIDMFPKGIFNIHPSLLPSHRGSTPLESVILGGETETGVSIMRLVKDMDAGPVYAQTRLVLNGDETKEGLANKLIQQGIDELLKVLPAVSTGGATSTEQEHDRATYDQRIDKSDGVIDWSKPALQIEREVRAYAGWPRSRTSLGSIDVAVTKAHTLALDKETPPGQLVMENKAGCLAVACGDANYLCIEQLIPAGKKEMPVDAFIRGYGQRIKAISDI